MPSVRDRCVHAVPSPHRWMSRLERSLTEEIAVDASLHYISGYGWHVGRWLVYSVLWFCSLLSWIVWVPFELVLWSLSGLRLPYGLVGPLLLGLWVRRRLHRKLNGEPFVVVPRPFFETTSNYPAEFIYRTQDPVRFKQMFRLDVIGWGGAILIQSVILLGWRFVAK